MSKFITINVLVGSRKGTETLLLCRALKAMEKSMYDRFLLLPKRNLVRLYLDGKLSASPSDTNVYAGFMFYAANRSVSYVTDRKKIICSRTRI